MIENSFFLQVWTFPTWIYNTHYQLNFTSLWQSLLSSKQCSTVNIVGIAFGSKRRSLIPDPRPHLSHDHIHSITNNEPAKPVENNDYIKLFFLGQVMFRQSLWHQQTNVFASIWKFQLMNVFFRLQFVHAYIQADTVSAVQAANQLLSWSNPGCGKVLT